MDPLAALYRRYAGDVFRFSMYLCGNRADAEDITSETFLRAWASSEPIRTETEKAYLLTIARHVYLKGVRRSGRQGDGPTEVRDTAPGIQLQLENRAELAAVMTRLAALPEVDRAAVLLRTVEGLSYGEIAEALSISEVAARVKVHRARAALLELRSAERDP